jgi:hypothetical protein
MRLIFADCPSTNEWRSLVQGKYISGPEEYCKFDDVEHFVDGYYYFIGSTDYPKWHLLADRPMDFISYLQEQGFPTANETYVEDIKAIYDSLAIPEINVIRHVVSHGEYTYKIAETYNVPPENVFRVGQNGSVQYGISLGVLYTGDLLYVSLTAQSEIDGKHKPIKGEFPGFAIRGKLIHVETDYEKNGRPTEAQYNTLRVEHPDAHRLPRHQSDAAGMDDGGASVSVLSSRLHGQGREKDERSHRDRRQPACAPLAFDQSHYLSQSVHDCLLLFEFTNGFVIGSGGSLTMRSAA